MSMNREEAIDYLRNEIENAHRFSNDHQTYHESLQALSILAPEPRKEPLPIGDVVWLWDEFMCAWCLSKITKHGSPFAIWLPLSALPKGGV